MRPTITGGAGMEDAVNSGSGSKHTYYARNYIEGGGGISGCGLIFEGSGTDNGIMEDNVLISTAGCGINVATAAYATVRRNKLLGPFETVDPGSGQLGIGNWYHPATPAATTTSSPRTSWRTSCAPARTTTSGSRAAAAPRRTTPRAVRQRGS